MNVIWWVNIHSKMATKLGCQKIATVTQSSWRKSKASHFGCQKILPMFSKFCNLITNLTNVYSSQLCTTALMFQLTWHQISIKKVILSLFCNLKFTVRKLRPAVRWDWYNVSTSYNKKWKGKWGEAKLLIDSYERQMKGTGNSDESKWHLPLMQIHLDVSYFPLNRWLVLSHKSSQFRVDRLWLGYFFLSF